MSSIMDLPPAPDRTAGHDTDPLITGPDAGLGEYNDLAAACFFNALLRETTCWYLVSKDDGDVAVLPVTDGELHLRLRHRSASGECRFDWPVRWARGDEHRALDFTAALDHVLATPALIGALDDEGRARFRERVLESRANTLASLAARDDLAQLQRGPLTFSNAEQGLLAGHAFHPAPKSRAPFTAHEAQRYCPEHRARFGLGWWAVAPEILADGSSRDASATELSAHLLPADLAERLPAGFAALPMHPWQARHLKQQPSVQALQQAGQLIWLGEGKPNWYPTSSHRSLYAPGAPWMVKSSLSARLTNSLRLLSVKEVERGERLDDWMRDLAIGRRFPGFAVMQEPAWLGWRDASGNVDPASLTLLRENPLSDSPDAEAVVLATLTQQPLAVNGETLLAARVRATTQRLGEPLDRVARGWFAAFCEQVLTPLFGLAVEDGIVLLAHQQNIVLRLDDGWPVGMFYRDCQGSGVSDRFLAQRPKLDEPPENHWSNATLRRYFLYYLLINSAFAVTSALAADGLADEATLLADLRAHLEGLCERLDGDHDCLEHALNAPCLEAKGNFFCYLSGVNESTLAEPARLYLPLTNPLLEPAIWQHCLATERSPRMIATLEGKPASAPLTTALELEPLQDRAARLCAQTSATTAPLIEQIDAAFAHRPDLDLLVLDPEDWRTHPDWPALNEAMGSGRVLRSAFYQQPWHWLGHPPATPDDTPFDTEAGLPLRPAKPRGEVYCRHDPRLGRTFSLRLIEPERDLERFVRWMHLPRVAEFWEQAWPEAELAAFIERRLADAHTLPLVGEFDGQPFGYFELYWAAEDRLAPYYPWAAFDRGLHLLVGEENVRGPQFVDAWLAGLCHYAYLAEPRTTRLVLEPRHDNQRLFRHLERLGLSRLRDFDFPHKRASLVMGQRERFFREIL